MLGLFSFTNRNPNLDKVGAGKFVVGGKPYQLKDAFVLAPDLMSATVKSVVSVDGKTWVPWFTQKATKVQDDEKSAVEATVRGFEQACQDYNFAKANSLLKPDARWIEYSLPVKFDDEWRQFEEVKAAGIRITYRLHDFVTHVQGEVAWVTLTNDGTFSADSAEGQKLLLQSRRAKEDCLWPGTLVSCSATIVETMILVKTPSGWKIALGHSSRAPKDQK